ncbi:MAG: PAS domain S-box protein [Chloroflexota bacterium]|nr:PAS domain S-box protein [Chloroflexota bacterium]
MDQTDIIQEKVDTRPTIVVADDNKGTRQLIRRSLEDMGLHVKCVASGAEVLQETAQNGDLLLVLDYRLEDMNAKDLVKKLNSENHKVPFIVLTGYDNVQTAVEMMKLGALEYVVKGIDFLDQIPEVVNRTVEKLINDAASNKQTSDTTYLDRDFAESLFKTAQVIILVLDIEGRIVQFNPYMEVISGYRLEEVHGKDWFDTFLPEQDHSRIRELFRNAVQDIQTHGNINPIITKDGFERQIEWYDKTLKDADGNCIGLLAIGQDITKCKRTEEELHETDEKYRALFQEALDAIFVADAETGILIDCNPAALTMVERERDDVIGHHQRSLHPQDSNTGAFSPSFLEHVHQNNGQSIETQVITSDGKLRDVSIKASIINLGNRKVLQGVFRDISDQIRARDELLQTTDHLNAVLESATQFCIASIDLEGNVLSWNKGAELVTGRSREEVVGTLRVGEMLGPELEKAGLREKVMVDTFSKGVFKGEIQAFRKSGEPFPAEVSVTPLKDKHNNVVGMLCIAQDITDRLQAQNDLQESEDRYSTIVEGSNDGIIIVNLRDFKTVFGNQKIADLLGYSLSEGLGLEVLQFISPDDLPKALQKQERRIAGEDVPSNSELNLIHKEGHLIPVEINSAMIEYGGEAAVVVFIRDITERKQAEESIKEYSEDLSIRNLQLEAARTELAIFNQELEQKVAERTADLKKAYEEMAESEARYRLLADNITDMIWSTDLSGRLIYTSPSITNLIGYTPEEIEGKSLLEIMKDIMTPQSLNTLVREFGKEASQEYINQIAENKTISVEYEVIRKDGERIWIESKFDTIKDSQGLSTGLTGISRNITKRKEAETSLARTVDHLNAILNSATDFCITATDQEGYFTSWNAGATAILGYTEEEAIRQLHTSKLVDPETTPASFLEEIVRIATKAGSYTGEFNAIRKNGEKFPAEINVTTITNQTGDIAGLLAITQDITERKRAEEALDRTNKQLKNIFDNVDVILLSLDLGNARLLEISPGCEKIFGLSQEKFFEHPMLWKELAHPDDLPSIDAKLSEVCVGKSVRTDYRIICPDGEIRWLDCNISPSLDGSGNLIRVDGIVSDATDRKRAEEALQKYTYDLSVKNHQLKVAQDKLSQLNSDLSERTAEVEELLKYKDELIHRMGHDLKSPLTPILSLLPLIKSQETDIKRQKLLDTTINSATYMRELISQILKLARLNAPGSVIQLEDTSLQQELDRVLAGRHILAMQKGIEIRNELRQDVLVRAESLSLQELLDNLIGNALEFTSEGGKIVVNAEPNGTFVDVSVRDSGIGMDTEQLTRAFNEFYRADPTKDELRSSGLGLAISKRIVEKHGGKIWAESPGLGKGSTFHFMLQIANGNSNYNSELRSETKGDPSSRQSLPDHSINEGSETAGIVQE